MKQSSLREVAADSRQTNAWLSTCIAYLAFVATGVGVTLPGAMLPLLLGRWSMSDQRAGLLFFLFFIGSIGGALLSRGSLKRSIARGCIAVALGMSALALASRISAFAAITLYGMGLGITMTSVSLLQSRLHATKRAAQMARLNFIWALGACFGPWIGLHGSALWGVSRVLYSVAIFFAVVGALALVFVQHAEADAVSTSGWWKQAREAPALLLILVPLSTGIESAVGGWLSTYAKRSRQSLGDTISAVTWFWAGMLLSRLVQSHERVARESVRLLLWLSPWLIAAALALMIGESGGFVLLVAALILGLAIGPMYPLMLALVLRRGEGGNAVFLAGGIGASMLPLLTGVVSGATGSLRSGLGVPLVGAALMGCAGLFVVRTETALIKPPLTVLNSSPKLFSSAEGSSPTGENHERDL
jgi:MFS transporter, FHS family, glucose/mannose:H+ symporter